MEYGDGSRLTGERREKGEGGREKGEGGSEKREGEGESAHPAFNGEKGKKCLTHNGQIHTRVMGSGPPLHILREGGKGERY